jgi:osmoprotectant transport system permease protein
VAEGAGAVSAALLVPGFLGSFGGALDFIFSERESVQGGLMVGGLGQIWELLVTQMAISVAALLLAIAIALPLGLWLGHRGVGEFAAVAIGNAGRAIPELALIALMVAFIGTGNLNVTIAVTILGIPPILTNAFVGVRQADRGAVDAARGMGMSELAIITRVELPLAVPTIMGGVRTASVNIIATATIGSLAGVKTLGDLILSPNVYGEEGVIAGAIVVALLALAFELILAAVQRTLTPRGLVLQRAAAGASA